MAEPVEEQGPDAEPSEVGVAPPEFHVALEREELEEQVKHTVRRAEERTTSRDDKD